MSVSVATSYTHEGSVMESTSAVTFTESANFPRPLLLRFDDSIGASILQRAVPSMSLRGLRNALLIEAAALVAIVGGWWLVRLF